MPVVVLNDGIQLRQGTNLARAAYVGKPGEPSWTTDTRKVFVHDGAIAGGALVGPEFTVGGTFERVSRTLDVGEVFLDADIRETGIGCALFGRDAANSNGGKPLIASEDWQTLSTLLFSNIAAVQAAASGTLPATYADARHMIVDMRMQNNTGAAYTGGIRWMFGATGGTSNIFQLEQWVGSLPDGELVRLVFLVPHKKGTADYEWIMNPLGSSVAGLADWQCTAYARGVLK